MARCRSVPCTTAADYARSTASAAARWLAKRENRAPRTREQLATLIDTSVYREALALEPRQ